MAQFEGSNVIINGGHFIRLEPHEDSVQLRRIVEKDSSLNQYSIQHGTVTIPYFPKSLLLQDLQVDPDAGRIGAGSCSFDLLARLGLFPGQPNEALAEYDTGVPLDLVVSHGNSYCGRISRHGFIFLVSKYFQRASMGETTKGGRCFILSTSIGRFRCYETDDRTFVHFDSGTRSSNVDLVKDQNLNDIFRASRGEYLIAGAAAKDAVNIDSVFEWSESAGKSIESSAAIIFYGAPNAVIYMTKSTLQRWKRLKQYAFAVIAAVLSILEGTTEPAEFVLELRRVPFDSDTLPNDWRVESSAPAAKLASCIFLYRVMSRRDIRGWPYPLFHQTVVDSAKDAFEAHKYFRSPRVEALKFVETSQDRFLKILDGFQTDDDFNGAGRRSKDHVQRELQTLLQTNKNNVALVAIQGFFAVVLLWNAARILLRAREAPDEWNRFIGADEDILYIG